MTMQKRVLPADTTYAVDDLERAVYLYDPKAGRVDLMTGAVLGGAGAALIASPGLRSVARVALNLGGRAMVLALAYEAARALGRRIAEKTP